MEIFRKKFSAQNCNKQFAYRFLARTMSVIPKPTSTMDRVFESLDRSNRYTAAAITNKTIPATSWPIFTLSLHYWNYVSASLNR